MKRNRLTLGRSYVLKPRMPNAIGVLMTTANQPISIVFLQKERKAVKLNTY